MAARTFGGEKAFIHSLKWRFLAIAQPAGHSVPMSRSSQDFILIAVADEVARPEAAHAAAVTGVEVVTAEDPRDIARLAPRARAVLVCAATAAHVAALGRRTGLFLVAADPGPIDYEAGLRCHAEQAFVLPSQAPELLTALGNKHTQIKPTRHKTIAVTGACGGVGASTLAAALARHAAPSVLVDGIHGSGGLDLLMGLETVNGARWPDLQLGGGGVDAGNLVQALPATHDGVAVLSAARAGMADPFTLTLDSVDRVLGSLRTRDGLTIVDVPRGVIPGATDHVVVLTAAEVRPVAAAAAMVAQLHADSVPYQLVVRHRGWSGLGVEDVERICHADVSAEIPLIRTLPKSTELGGLPGRLPKGLAQACGLILEEAGWFQ